MIEPTWHPSGAPCDSCGEFQDNHRLVVTLTNKKARLGYKLPDLTLCARCRYYFERAMRQLGLVNFPGHPPVFVDDSPPI